MNIIVTTWDHTILSVIPKFKYVYFVTLHTYL